MRKRGMWAVAATLVLGLAASGGAAGEEIGSRSTGRSWWDRLFNWSGKSGEVPVDAEEVAARLAEAEAKVRTERGQREARRARADFLRRQDVVNQLIGIAVRTGDSDLERRARELEERAWAVYEQKAPRRAFTPPPVDLVEEAPENAPWREKP